MAKAAPVFNINMDQKCSRCGKEGACDNGLCLKCVGDNLRDPVGEKTLAKILAQVHELFETYETKINQAIKKNENQLDITFTAKLANYAGQVAVQTFIGFTAEKIKDSSERDMVSEIQTEMEFVD